MDELIAIGCDHAGFALKGKLMRYLGERGFRLKDMGTYSEESCDYPDIALALGRAVVSGECARGILICGTGIGMSIAANKIAGIRAACCSDTYSARFTRLHNDANVLCIGARVVGEGLAADLAEILLTTPFEKSGNHPRRVAKLSDIEKL